MFQNGLLFFAGVALVFVGGWFKKNTERVYRTYSKVLGSGAFPPEGRKHDKWWIFFHQFGWLLQLMGAASALSAIYSLVVGR